MVTKSKSRAGKRKQPPTAKSLSAEKAQPANGDAASPSNQDVLRTLYASMLKCRILAERVQCLPGGQRHPDDYAFDIGHEAIVVGATVELGPEDTLVASPRNFAAHVAKGVLLETLMSRGAPENGARAVVVTDRSPAGAVSFDPFNLGTGLALAHRLEKKRNVVVALCTEESCVPDTDPSLRRVELHGARLRISCHRRGRQGRSSGLARRSRIDPSRPQRRRADAD